jgi:hypothetical protein
VCVFVPCEVFRLLSIRSLIRQQKRNASLQVRIPMKSATYSDGSRPVIPMKSATP